MPTTSFDYKKITDIDLGDAISSEYPEYESAYIERAKYEDREMTQDEIDDLNEDRDFVYETVFDFFN